MAGRIKLGELLVRAGVLDDYKLKAALAEQQRWGGRLGRILVEMNFVSEDLLVRALSKQLGLPRARLDRPDVPSDVLTRIDPQFAQANSLCPERYLAEKKSLVVAMSDPTNVAAIDELRFKTGLRIETSLAGEFEITQAIDRVFYGRAPIEGIEMSTDPGSPANMAAELRIPAESVGHGPPPLPGSARSQPPRVQPLAPGPAQPTAPAQGPAQGSAHFQAHPAPYSAQGVNGWSAPPGPSSPPHAYGAPAAPMYGPPSSATSSRPGPSGFVPIGAPQVPQGQPAAVGGAALEMAVALDASQKRQLKAIRVMLELLIEKGVFSRDEYMALVNRR